MKKKCINGFTLVELLAVIAILAVVFLIAFNQISNSFRKNSKNTIVANANVFVKAVNEAASMSRMTASFEDGEYDIQTLYDMGLSLTGTKPESGGLTIKNGVVNSGCLKYAKGYAEIKNEVVSYSNNCTFETAGT